MSSRLSLILLVSMLICGCGKSSETPFILPENAPDLLSGGSEKTWKLAKRYNDGTRMNMADCFLSHRETYVADGQFKNNSSESPDCGESLIARWELLSLDNGKHYIKLQSRQIPELMGGDKDYKLFEIKALTDSSMVLRFSHRQFSDKTTIITDYWVPEGVSVSDRNFHW